jgi:hypothetical protein
MQDLVSVEKKKMCFGVVGGVLGRRYWIPPGGQRAENSAQTDRRHSRGESRQRRTSKDLA